ncbi:MAG: DNA alkylation repair protein [bacterium]|nr:DNA alkylation repair protein [bacterium]
MPEKLKNIYFTDDSMKHIAETVKDVYPSFEKETFLQLLFNDGWKALELKEKMRHLTVCLHKTLPEDYVEALEVIKKIAPHIEGFEAMSMPDFVECRGLDDFETSLPALGYLTKFASAEFAVRPFLDRDPQSVLEYMDRWTDDEDEAVRRLASEGSRPRLPWAMALPKFKKDPAPILPVLEKLKNDPSETVRRSVANNLNDISKDNPDIALDVCEKWFGQTPETDAVVKHACRTLLKAGHKRALRLFGYSDPADIKLESMEIEDASLSIGDSVKFTFDFAVTDTKECLVRLEYRIDFVKAKGKYSGKTFKITENTYKPGTYTYTRKHSLANMSTRKHYPGTHYISIILNGEEKEKQSFELN